MVEEVTSEAEVKPTTASFKLKGGLYPFTSLELTRYSRASIEEELLNKVSETPDFFHNTPVVLSTEHYEEDQCDINLVELKEICHNSGLVLIALRGGNETLQKKAVEIGMGLIPVSRKKGANSQDINAASKSTNGTLNNSTHHAAKINKFINTPIRSGQQIYAAGGDLIVTAPVSAGAEILADGSIHVYGPVRGRILAGVRGDTSARVFCQSLEAELISIAGHFTTDEDSQSQHWKTAVQIYLAEEVLCIEPLLSQPL